MTTTLDLLRKTTDRKLRRDEIAKVKEQELEKKNDIAAAKRFLKGIKGRLKHTAANGGYRFVVYTLTQHDILEKDKVFQRPTALKSVGMWVWAYLEDMKLKPKLEYNFIAVRGRHEWQIVVVW